MMSPVCTRTLTLPPKFDIIPVVSPPRWATLSGCGAVGSAPRLGRGGRPFKSDHPDQYLFLLGEQVDKVKNQARLAKLKLTGVGGWFRRHLAFSIILGVVIVAFVGSLIFTAVYYRDKSAPGVTIANVSAGGRTRQQILGIIDGLVSNMRLSLTYGGKSVTASASDLGISINRDQIADEVVKTGQGNPCGVVLNRRHFDLTGSYNREKVKEFVTNNFPELTTSPVDAQVIYSTELNHYVVQPGAIGKSVQLDKLYDQVDHLLASPQLTSYEIAISDSKPVVSDESAQATVDHMNSVINKSIQIVNNGRVIWTLDPWDIAKWASFTADSNTQSYTISYDQDKIKQFVKDTITEQLSNKPVNQQAITNKSGQVLQVVRAGKDGQVASNIDSVAQQIYDKLVDDQAGRIELLTKDAPYGTDATVASDGHWIEANLSTYEVKLYDGKNVVWSTDQTSHGKTDTPTITGLYKVWRKTYEQCMPNPPSPTPLCNIHYVTYWEKSGYAFHEAWWLGASNIRQGISHGCINMYQADAKRVYDWASIGTPVWVHW